MVASGASDGSSGWFAMPIGHDRGKAGANAGRRDSRSTLCVAAIIIAICV